MRQTQPASSIDNSPDFTDSYTSAVVSTKFIEPGSALDWATVYQLCKVACEELVAANPHEPMRGRIDLYRPVEHEGRRYMMRVKLTLVPAGSV